MLGARLPVPFHQRQSRVAGSGDVSGGGYHVRTGGETGSESSLQCGDYGCVVHAAVHSAQCAMGEPIQSKLDLVPVFESSGTRGESEPRGDLHVQSPRCRASAIERSTAKRRVPTSVRVTGIEPIQLFATIARFGVRAEW
mmetsp:Transcript_17139/g.21005  ORF Transcript_17139/g.21005 Transcript_17139/m.21005 type:complete len:140 (-) Transcript_17139:2925-3344(-)